MNVWLIVGIFLFIAIVAGILLYVFWPDLTGRGSSPSNGGLIPIEPEKAGFLQLCNTVVICDEGLSCDAGICKRNIGGECEILSDCISEATACDKSNPDEPGVCVSGPIGGLNQPAPCNEGLTANEDGICKLSVGAGCTAGSSSDCVNSLCINNVCSAGLELGDKCSANQCKEGLMCNQGFCQMDGIISGTTGAYCIPGQPWPPTEMNTGPGCPEGLLCDDNICKPANRDLGEGCSTENLCISPLACINSICMFQDPPNTCPAGLCMDSYDCTGMGTNSRCIGNENALCSNDMTCFNSNCTSDPGNNTKERAIFEFKTNDWVKTILIPTNIAFTKLQSQSQNSTDTLFAFAGNDREKVNTNSIKGLYRYDSMTQMWIHVLKAVEGVNTLNNFCIAPDNKIYVCGTNTTENKGTLFEVTFDNSGSGVLNGVGSSDGIQSAFGLDLISILDVDVSSNNDFVISSNTTFGGQNVPSLILFLKNGETEFMSTSSAVEGSNPRFYDGTGSSEMNFGYIEEINDDSSDQKIKFSGQLNTLSFPESSSKFVITDFSVNTNSTSGVEGGDLWFSSIREDGESYIFQILSGTEFQIPGYVDLDTIMLTTGNKVHVIGGFCS